MLSEIFIALGGMAFLLTIGVVVLSMDEESKVVLTMFSFILWAVWAFQAPSVRHVAADGSTITQGYTSLLIIGILFALLMAVSFIMQALAMYERA